MTKPPQKSQSVARPAEPVEEHWLLADMRANPKGDWKIKDVETVCNALGIRLRAGAKHYVACSDLLVGALTIPAARPIKPPYIKNFVAMCEAHIRVLNGDNDVD